MKHFVINGKFMADRMQGIVRYGRELIKALDCQLDDRIEVEIALPPNVYDAPVFSNIQSRVLPGFSGIAWEQITLARYLRKHPEYVCINLCNTAPLFIQPGVTAIHDIMYKTHPEFYTTTRNRISRLWHICQYAYILRHEIVVLTVSEFSRREIESNYPASTGKIAVVPDSWQHVLGYKENAGWRESYPDLVPDEFYFSMATLAKNKNGRWIIEVARKNPKSIFAIAGKHYETDNLDIPSNVKFLGFISDEDACSLIKNCKAFIFPSLYEGFGLPPLEACALGARVIVSSTSSLPEILKNTAFYVDPFDYDLDLDDLLSKHVVQPSENLSRFGWDKSAEKLLRIIYWLSE